jgi:hypothetical protein
MPRLETVAGYPILTLNWTREVSEGDLHHFFAYRFSELSDVTSSAPIYKRLFAHLLLDELPDTALPEILKHLSDAWLFYQPTAPEVQSEPRVLKGRVTRRYERPTYSIDEE